MPNRKPAIVVVTIHAGDHSRAVFGPFANGDEASKWGFKSFPDNTAPTGDSVTWCWEYLIDSSANVFDAIHSSVV
jgi:hypothetical protein